MYTEAPGTDQGSSWRSETPEDPQTSPAPSSCATPNSATDLPDAELSYTVGITEATPYACQFCDKAFPRLSFLKKHEQVCTRTYTTYSKVVCMCCVPLYQHQYYAQAHTYMYVCMWAFIALRQIGFTCIPIFFCSRSVCTLRL